MIEGAKGILINITSGNDIKLLEIDNAITRHVRDKADADANVIFGVVIDPDMQEEMKVTILATGSVQKDRRDFKSGQKQEERPYNSATDRKANPKVSLPYVEKKGFSETVENENDDLNELVFAEKATNSVGSPSYAERNKNNEGTGRGGLPPMSKSLFSNLKKER